MLQTKIIWSILISRSPYLQKGQTWCFGEVMYHDGPKQTFADILQNRCYWNFCKIHRKHLCWSLFLPSFKRDSSTDNFLWIWQNFQAYLFYRAPPGEYLWKGNQKVNVREFMELDEKNTIYYCFSNNIVICSHWGKHYAKLWHGTTNFL